MEKSYETTHSEGVCKKLYQAIGSNCASRKSTRSGSDSLPPPPLPEAAVITGESVKVHIESVPITTSNEGKINGRRVGHVSVWTPISHPRSSHEHKSREGNQYHENMYSDYITRMKNKMGISPAKNGFVGETTNNAKLAANRLASRRDSFNDKIVHFISRGRKKMKGPSDFPDQD